MTRWAKAVLLLATSGGLVGCGPGEPLGSRCLPDPLTVTPAEAAAGSTVTPASAGFSCAGDYDEGHGYDLSLYFAGRQEAVDLGSVPVDRDGSFSARLTLPADASPGEAGIAVSGSPYDECADDPGTSCAG